MSHSIEQLRAVISYVPDEGKFIRSSGKEAKGTSNGKGYLLIKVLGKLYRAHRLAWILHYGNVPTIIDHINNNKEDNRIANLRIATATQNKANTQLQANNTIGFKGVSRAKNNRFCAQIGHGYKRYYLGTFDTAKQAHCAYRGAAIILFGEFACP
jgi:hypothetical protein